MKHTSNQKKGALYFEVLFIIFRNKIQL